MYGASRVVIVGASTGGLTAAEALRANGFTGTITIIGEEVHLPYHRPPLSKQVLTGEWPVSRSSLRSAGSLASLQLRLLLGSRATALDPVGHTVSIGNRRIPYDTVIIATGVSARRLPGVAAPAGTHVLRTIDDALAIRAAFERGGRVVVVGGGVLGSEIAAAARTCGLEVVLVGRTERPRLGQVEDDRLSSMVVALHRENGVAVVSGVTVAGILGRVRVQAVACSDGSEIPADVVVTAIGGIPATGWLAGSGLDLDDGVLCDATGCAALDVYAVGDVARWADTSLGHARRAEHQLNAAEQALAVAQLLTTGERPVPIVPFFWSELYGTRIQAFGRFAADHPLETIAGDPAGRRFVAASRADGRITGIVGWNMPREFRDARALVTQPTETRLEGVQR